MKLTDLPSYTWASVQIRVLRAFNTVTDRLSMHAGRQAILMADNAQHVAALAAGIFIGLTIGALLADQLVLALGYAAPLLSIAMLQVPVQQRAKVRLREQLSSQQATPLPNHQKGQKRSEQQSLLPRMASFSDEEGVTPLVEDALRHLHDRSYLGQHQLAQLQIVKRRSMSDVSSLSTHVSNGHALHSILVDVIGQLRPKHPLPTGAGIPELEWRPYTILHSHYVQRELTREIMAKLYIGEGTYNRARRSAVQGIVRAIMELECQTESQSGCH
jgi:hypothetical protein